MPLVGSRFQRWRLDASVYPIDSKQEQASFQVVPFVHVMSCGREWSSVPVCAETANSLLVPNLSVSAAVLQ